MVGDYGLRTDNYPDGFSEYWFERYWGDPEDDDDDGREEDDGAEWE